MARLFWRRFATPIRYGQEFLRAVCGEDPVESLWENAWVIRPASGINTVSVLFLKGREWWVTDPGMTIFSFGKRRAVRALMRRTGVSRLGGIILTHAHPDHIGELPFYLRFAAPYAPVYAHRDEFFWIMDPLAICERMEKVTKADGRTFRPAWKKALYRALGPFVYGPGLRGSSSWRDHGHLMPYGENPLRFDGFSVEALPLPGHSPREVGFLVRHEGDRYHGTDFEHVVLTGDLVTNLHRGRDVFPSLTMPDCNIHAALASLEKLQELRPTMLIVTHGEPIRGEQAVAERLAAMAQTVRNVIANTKLFRRQWPDWPLAALTQLIFQVSGLSDVPSLGVDEQQSAVVSVLRDAPP